MKIKLIKFNDAKVLDQLLFSKAKLMSSSIFSNDSEASILTILFVKAFSIFSRRSFHLLILMSITLNSIEILPNLNLFWVRICKRLKSLLDFHSWCRGSVNRSSYWVYFSIFESLFDLVIR